MAAAVALILISGGAFWFLNQNMLNPQENLVLQDVKVEKETATTLQNSEIAPSAEVDAGVESLNEVSPNHQSSAPPNDAEKITAQQSRSKETTKPLKQQRPPSPPPNSYVLNSTTDGRDEHSLSKPSAKKKNTNEENDIEKYESLKTTTTSAHIEVAATDEVEEEQLGEVLAAPATTMLKKSKTEARDVQEDQWQIEDIMEDKIKKDQVMTVEKAAPLMGFSAFKQYIKKNMRLTEAAKASGISGPVVIQFNINTDGSLSDFKILKSSKYGLEEEAIRLLKEGGKWTLPAGSRSAIETYEFEFK